AGGKVAIGSENLEKGLLRQRPVSGRFEVRVSKLLEFALCRSLSQVSEKPFETREVHEVPGEGNAIGKASEVVKPAGRHEHHVTGLEHVLHGRDRTGKIRKELGVWILDVHTALPVGQVWRLRGIVHDEFLSSVDLAQERVTRPGIGMQPRAAAA